MRPEYTPNFVNRFWSKVDRHAPGGCWIWCGGAGSRGYATISFMRDKKECAALVHRVAWEIARGPIPDGLFVCHNCPSGDNKLCVNPAHLFLGTHRDNMADMARKGRAAHGGNHVSRLHPERVPRGERHGMAKLTIATVREIRTRHVTEGLSFKQIAVLFGISDVHAARIIRLQSWQDD